MDPATEFIDQMSAQFRLNTQISHQVHEQGKIHWIFNLLLIAYDSYT